MVFTDAVGVTLIVWVMEVTDGAGGTDSGGVKDNVGVTGDVAVTVSWGDHFYDMC